jgi:hypothetical protein
MVRQCGFGLSAYFGAVFHCGLGLIEGLVPGEKAG